MRIRQLWLRRCILSILLHLILCAQDPSLSPKSTDFYSRTPWQHPMRAMLFFKFWSPSAPPVPHFEEYRSHVIQKYGFTPSEVAVLQKASMDCIHAYDELNSKATAEVRQRGALTEREKTEIRSRHLERQMYLIEEHMKRLFHSSDTGFRDKLTRYLQGQHQNFTTVQLSPR